MDNTGHGHTHKLSLAGILVSLGIIYGDIGTSPLYVMSAIIGKSVISEELVLGGVSAVFWTITLITTIKYVVFILRADNNGEGGIFSLYALIKRKRKISYLIWIAIIGGSMLMAEGIITPPISISSAVEGLQTVLPNIPTIPIVIGIIISIFAFQQLGTSKVGKAFGPIMLVWFMLLAILGTNYIIQNPTILKAVSPLYAIKMIVNTPGGFWLLGAVFLCTTGVEALYSDLGHVGLDNIRASWVFVKLCLMLNYFGQGAWLLSHIGQSLEGRNPFFQLMPQWFLIFGVVIATLAAIVASQALITGSFTLISEAIKLNLFPKVEIRFPSMSMGQIYVPFVNNFLLIGCIAVVLIFKKAAAMEAAYGLSISITMLMSSLLLREYLITKRYNKVFIWSFYFFFLIVELSFFAANLIKFTHGGYFTFLVSIFFIAIMYSRWYTVTLRQQLREYVPISDYLDQLMLLSKDQSLPKYATNLVFLSTSPKEKEVEYKIMYSILQKQPKRADNYWFVHVHVTKHPYTCEYKVDTISKDDVYRITFYLGFKIEEKISQFLRVVIEDMVQKGEVNINSRYHSLMESNITGDFRFVLLEEVLSAENELPLLDKLAIKINLWLKNFTATPEKWFNLDTNLVTVEKVPLIIKKGMKETLLRVEENKYY